MSRHYQAPEHTTAVFSPIGEHRADENGIIELADDAPDSADEALRRVGCALLPSAATATEQSRPDRDSAKAKPSA